MVRPLDLLDSVRRERHGRDDAEALGARALAEHIEALPVGHNFPAPCYH